GVVTCLAAMAGFQAWGFEAQGRLVRGARQLAADFDLPAEFTCGSFIPAGARRGLLVGREFAWLRTGGRCGHEALGIGLGEFDVVSAYPWPDEEGLVEELFEGHARPGALLMTYHGERGLWLRRKDGRALRQAGRWPQPDRQRGQAARGPSTLRRPGPAQPLLTARGRSAER